MLERLLLGFHCMLEILFCTVNVSLLIKVNLYYIISFKLAGFPTTEHVYNMKTLLQHLINIRIILRKQTLFCFLVLTRGAKLMP